MSAPAAYTVHAADLARDRELILGLWRGNLGQNARMAAKYDWFYHQCPYGAPLTLLKHGEGLPDARRRAEVDPQNAALHAASVPDRSHLRSARSLQREVEFDDIDSRLSQEPQGPAEDLLIDQPTYLLDRQVSDPCDPVDLEARVRR